MPQKLLPKTAVKILALPKAPAGKTVEYLDSREPGFGLRVTSNGHKSFFVRKRVKGSGEIIRFTLDSAKFPISEPDEARDKARQLLKLIANGGSPKQVEAEETAAQQRKRKSTFAAVVEDFIEQKLPYERRGDEIERDIRIELLPVWGALPFSEITDDQIASVVKARAAKKWKGQKTKTAARNLLALIKRIFQWAIDQREYGIKVSPAATIRPKPLGLKSAPRGRALDDDEIFALWRAAKRMAYPYGRAYQLLLLTALRLNEVAHAKRSEFNPKKRVWVIPSARMKGTNEDARPHAVPLTAEILNIFENLPEPDGGEFLFSTTLGRVPVQMSDKIKKKLDRRMERTLRALARRRGENPRKVKLEPWRNHDVRRTARTRLSRLKISERAREEVLAHARPKIQGTYDVHDYLDEKREALELWAAALMRIVEPRDDNVTRLRA